MSSSPRMGDLFGGDDARTWLNLPEGRISEEMTADIAILGIGSATPYPLGSYCKEAPDAIRKARTWPGMLDHHDFDLHGTAPSGGILPEGVTAVDCGNLDVTDSADAAITARNREIIRQHIGMLRRAGAVPFIFGGDDSIPIPVLEAYADEAPLSILQIDAHIDWRDEVDGERMGLSSNMRRASEMDHIGTIVQLAARGIGSARGGDVKDALNYGTRLHPMQQLLEGGGIARAIEDLPEGVPLYIALDVDSLDPVHMPAVIGAAPGGLNYWQMMEIFRRASERAPIIGFNMVEMMPAQDINGQGALMASRLGISMLGLIAGQIARGQP
ncbi:arginase family protein [Alphaproteobacteria bacterium LSUCC0684]